MAIGARHVTHDIERLAGNLAAEVVTVKRRSVIARRESSIGTRVLGYQRWALRTLRMDARHSDAGEVLTLATPDNSGPQSNVAGELFHVRSNHPPISFKSGSFRLGSIGVGAKFRLGCRVVIRVSSPSCHTSSFVSVGPLMVPAATIGCCWHSR